MSESTDNASAITHDPISSYNEGDELPNLNVEYPTNEGHPVEPKRAATARVYFEMGVFGEDGMINGRYFALDNLSAVNHWLGIKDAERGIVSFYPVNQIIRIEILLEDMEAFVNGVS